MPVCIQQERDMMLEGQSRKMLATLGETIQYSLRLGDETLDLNPTLIGQRIRLSFAGTILCIKCGRKTRKSFSQGFCYPCMQNAPENAECIIRPAVSCPSW